MISLTPFLAASQTHLDDGNSNHKKHKKEKKSKKDKKEKRDKDRHYTTNSNGEVVKKHKHKHKDKEKDREAPSSASAAAAASSSGGHVGGSNPIPKLKIKMNPPAEAADSSGLAPLKMSISGLGGSSNAASSKKRHRQHSDSSDSSMGSMGSSSAPALKMSRVLGTSAEQESSFLAERMGSYGIPKNSRKVRRTSLARRPTLELFSKIFFSLCYRFQPNRIERS